jgi:hypothetical protein
MKIIITEEQYKELSDWDIYSQLSPWSRRRMQYIDIKSSLERHIKRNTKMILDNPIEAAEGLIYKTIWDTVPLVWNVNMEEDEFDKYFHELYPLINKKYGEYIQSEVDRIYDEELDS